MIRSPDWAVWLVATLALAFVIWVWAERRSTANHLRGIAGEVLVHPFSICGQYATPELLREGGGAAHCRRVVRRMSGPFWIDPGDLTDGYVSLEVRLGGSLFAGDTALVTAEADGPDVAVRLARRGGHWRITQLRWVQSVRRDGRLVLGILGRPQRGDVAFSAGD
jgi:hypothetical protein